VFHTLKKNDVSFLIFKCAFLILFISAKYQTSTLSTVLYCIHCKLNAFISYLYVNIKCDITLIQCTINVIHIILNSYLTNPALRNSLHYNGIALFINPFVWKHNGLYSNLIYLYVSTNSRFTNFPTVKQPRKIRQARKSD
jgi:hypothetical protein